MAPVQSGGVKFACVVSKKTAARAVTRNRVQRQCRAAFRAAEYPQKPAALIFTAKKSAVGALYKDVVADVGALLQRVR